MRISFVAAMVICGMFVSVAQGVQPFYDQFIEKYAPPNGPLNKQAVATKCNICHVAGKPKKERNDYGNAVGKHLKKSDFIGNAKKFDPKTPAGKQAIDAGLIKAAMEKSANGPTFGEILNGGKLPANK